MGFSERCKNHPNHNEKQGVCASCLRERLSLLCSASYKEVNSILFASSSPSPYFSPADDSSLPSSTTASPAVSQHRKLNGFGGTGIKGLFSSSLSTTSSPSIMVKLGSIKGLKKSRSIALVTRNVEEEDAKHGKNKRKGFWSKLMSFKGKKKNVLTHSTSMRLTIGRVNQIF